VPDAERISDSHVREANLETAALPIATVDRLQHIVGPAVKRDTVIALEHPLLRLLQALGQQRKVL
jgi:hypothetical protein